MNDIVLADVTIHIDAETQEGTREKIENGLRGLHGVVSVHMPKEKPHLVVVEYDTSATKANHLLGVVRELAGHAELIGL